MPEVEREEWMKHFASVSRGRGHVDTSTWEALGPARAQDKWMGDAPEDAELDVALGGKKNGKAAGCDEVAAEAIKYGGDELARAVRAIVKGMWAKAARADPGKEADEWPPQWRRTLHVLLWKKKGCKKDTRTWRGITLLSVGTKVFE